MIKIFVGNCMDLQNLLQKRRVNKKYTQKKGVKIQVNMSNSTSQLLYLHL